ncbi:hypothetical protein [Corynebacterium sp. NML 150383]|uniref:hypothetical protein n=1 Tax=Corynebacterium sp. NML 150383 TaxID=2029400 RepID=UPI00351304DE
MPTKNAGPGEVMPETRTPISARVTMTLIAVTQVPVRGVRLNLARSSAWERRNSSAMALTSTVAVAS